MNRGLIVKSYIVFLSVALVFSLVTCRDASALDVKRTVAANGLTVLHVKQGNLPIVMVNLLIKASPLDEDAEKAGLANLTAELITEGTAKRTALAISSEIEFMGASLDASADSDFTTVTLSVLKKDIEKGFEVFSDIVLNPAFPEEEIIRRKTLIKGFLKQSEEEPSFVAGKAFKAAIYGKLPYGRLTSGTVESIDLIQKEDITGFYTAFYRPNNALITVVGDINEEELSALLGKYLGSWKAADIPKRLRHSEPAKEKKTILIDRELTQANIIAGHIGISRDNPDYYAVSIMNYILGGGGFSSRLMQTIRDEMGLAYDVHSVFVPKKEGGIFEASVQTKNESAKTVLEVIVKQINRIREELVTDQELEDAKAYLTGSFPRRLDTNRKVADFLSAVEFFGLGLDYIEKYPGYIRSVSRDDVLRVAKKYLDPTSLTTVVVGKQEKAKIKESSL